MPPSLSPAYCIGLSLIDNSGFSYTAGLSHTIDPVYAVKHVHFWQRAAYLPSQ